jgi:hypothetical protein
MACGRLHHLPPLIEPLPNADSLGRAEFARYDANEDARSWTRMSNLLAEEFR